MPRLSAICQRNPVRGSGATLMGERVTGVRVTPISGALVDRGAGFGGRIVSAGRGSMGSADLSVGAGGDDSLLVVGSVDTAVVVVDSTGVVVSSVPPGLPTINSTAEITSAAAAAPTAIMTASA